MESARVTGASLVRHIPLSFRFLRPVLALEREGGLRPDPCCPRHRRRWSAGHRCAMCNRAEHLTVERIAVVGRTPYRRPSSTHRARRAGNSGSCNARRHISPPARACSGFQRFHQRRFASERASFPENVYACCISSPLSQDAHKDRAAIQTAGANIFSSFSCRLQV